MPAPATPLPLAGTVLSYRRRKPFPGARHTPQIVLNWGTLATSQPPPALVNVVDLQQLALGERVAFLQGAEIDNSQCFLPVQVQAAGMTYTVPAGACVTLPLSLPRNSQIVFTVGLQNNRFPATAGPNQTYVSFGNMQMRGGVAVPASPIWTAHPLSTGQNVNFIGGSARVGESSTITTATTTLVSLQVPQNANGFATLSDILLVFSPVSTGSVNASAQLSFGTATINDWLNVGGTGPTVVRLGPYRSTLISGPSASSATIGVVLTLGSAPSASITCGWSFTLTYDFTV